MKDILHSIADRTACLRIGDADSLEYPLNPPFWMFPFSYEGMAFLFFERRKRAIGCLIPFLILC
jgi:hypothetical protein